MLLVTLRDLELRLLSPEVRSDPDQLETLLHPDFHEVGASGTVYTRVEVLAEFRGAPPTYSVWAQDFEAREVVDGVTLLSYLSAHMSADGALSRHAARTSLWQYIGSRWQIRFHQGTLTSPFTRRAT